MEMMIPMFADGREVYIKFAHRQVESSCSVLKCTFQKHVHSNLLLLSICFMFAPVQDCISVFSF